MKNLVYLLHYMKVEKKYYIFSILCMGVNILASLISPIIIQVTVDSVFGDQAISQVIIKYIINQMGGVGFLKKNLWVPPVILLFITLLRGVFSFLMGKLSAIASESTVESIKNNLYKHIQHLPFSYHKNVDTGDLIQRGTSDIDTIRKFLSVQMIEIGRVLFMISIALVIMARLNMLLTLIAMSCTPVIFVFAYLFFNKIQKAFLLSDEAEADMSTVIQENLNGVRVVKAFSREAYEIEKFTQKNKDYREKTYRLVYYLGLYWGISDLLCMIQIGLVLIFGTVMTINEEITLGTLIAFSTYITMLIFPIRQFGRILTDLGKALISIERIKEILDIPLEKESEKNLKPIMQGNIAIQNLSFQYEDEMDHYNLYDISLDIKKGEVVSIMGKTGSGKSTLVQILSGLYDYEIGSIQIDGIELKDINKNWLRKNVGLILQEPFLYSKTIGDNIDLRKENNMRAIQRSAKIVSLDEVIFGFEKGYETQVGEKGVTLSGGQQQRLAIARTIINHCPILIFDDSLSAVDTETEIAIKGELEKIRKDVTTIIITHRISSGKDADKVIVMDKGKIIQQGSHQELICKPGPYKDMWDIQNTLEDELKKDLG